MADLIRCSHFTGKTTYPLSGFRSNVRQSIRGHRLGIAMALALATLPFAVNAGNKNEIATGDKIELSEAKDENIIETETKHPTLLEALGTGLLGGGAIGLGLLALFDVPIIPRRLTHRHENKKEHNVSCDSKTNDYRDEHHYYDLAHEWHNPEPVSSNRSIWDRLADRESGYDPWGGRFGF